jgi:hypothetical protein
VREPICLCTFVSDAHEYNARCRRLADSRICPAVVLRERVKAVVYKQIVYKLSVGVRLLDKLGVVEFVADIAAKVRDLIGRRDAA